MLAFPTWGNGESDKVKFGVCDAQKRKGPAEMGEALTEGEVGRPMGFEPTTTGITIQDSTAELRPPLKLML